MKRILATVLLSLFSVVVVAKTVHPAISVIKIEEVRAAEKGGDELYLHITEYHSKKEAHNFTFPHRPTYWPSEHLHKIKNIKIWDTTLKEGDSTEVIISLLEQDYHPWNTDDLVGTIKLRLKNTDGGLNSNWSMPNRADAPDVINTKFGMAQKFTLIGDKHKYVLYLLLTDVKSANALSEETKNN